MNVYMAVSYTHHIIYLAAIIIALSDETWKRKSIIYFEVPVYALWGLLLSNYFGTILIAWNYLTDITKFKSVHIKQDKNFKWNKTEVKESWSSFGVMLDY